MLDIKKRQQVELFVGIIEGSVNEFARRTSEILLSEQSYEETSNDLASLKLETQHNLKMSLLERQDDLNLLQLENAHSSYQAISCVLEMIQRDYMDDSGIILVLRNVQRLNQKCLQSIMQRMQGHIGFM